MSKKILKYEDYNELEVMAELMDYENFPMYPTVCTSTPGSERRVDCLIDEDTNKTHALFDINEYYVDDVEMISIELI